MTVQRWVLKDTSTLVQWTMPINPDSATSPFSGRSFKFAHGWRLDQRPRAFSGARQAHEWEWAGVIRTKEHYDNLVQWAEKSVAVDVTDHLGRTFRVFLTEFIPVDRKANALVPWRLRYTMKALILERVA